MSLQREAELGRNSAQHLLLRSADENLKAEEMCPMVPSQQWAVPGPPSTESSRQRFERVLQAAKAERASPRYLTTFSAPWGTAGLLCRPKRLPPWRAWAWPTADAGARDEALRRQPRGCLSKLARWNPFWGETLALQLSYMTPAGAEDLEEDGKGIVEGRKLRLGI